MNLLGKLLLGIIWLALLLFGFNGVQQLFTEGRDLANYGSYVPWGLWVSAYIYFGGLSAGAFLFASLTYVFRIEKLQGSGRIALWIAAVTLLAGLVSIWLDLGQKWRVFEVFTRPHFSSMMTWMVWLYAVYFLIVVASLWLDMRCDLAQRAERGGVLAGAFRLLSGNHRCPGSAEGRVNCRRRRQRSLRILGCLGIPLTIAFSGGVGALFATLSARPYWHHPLFPILFLAGGLVSGGGLLLAVLALTAPRHAVQHSVTLRTLSYCVVGLICFDLLLEWAEFSIPMWYGVGSENDLLQVVLFGQHWYVFWIAHILLGTAVPLALLLWKPASRWTSATAGTLIAVTFLAVRLNLVIPGQVVPAMHGLASAYVDPRLQFDYLPSTFEWSVVAFLVAVAMAAFYLGMLVLPLNQTPPDAVQQPASS